VFIDRLVYWLRSPKRWEVVAFRTPGAEEHLAVKRVAGMPGETVSVRHGDVYIDGKIQRKSLDQLRDTAILVHDDAYRPQRERDFPRRWQAESVGSGWRCRNGITTFQPRLDGPDDLDWITYRHWRCVPGPAPRTEEYAVLDNYGYNQQVSRQLQRVTDLMLVCRLRSTWDAGALGFSIHDGRDRFQVVLLPARNEGRLHRNDSFLEAVKLPAAAYARDVKIELALCDRRVLFAIEQQVLIARAYEPAAGTVEPASRPLGIGATGLSVTIRHLQVFRDVYYLHPKRVGWDWSAPRSLGADEYFVLGDNAPLSEDSRHWTDPGLPRKLLLGKVLRGL
jgi:signal peptidase I